VESAGVRSFAQRATRYAQKPEIDESRRAIVRARQTRLTVADPHHGPVAPLVGDEVEDVGGGDLNRLLVDDGEERLQIVGDRPHRVRPRPPGHERQVRVDDRIAQRAAGPPPGIEVRTSHGNWFIPACSRPRAEDTGIPDGSSVYWAVWDDQPPTGESRWRNRGHHGNRVRMATTARVTTGRGRR
jgi:hypothetical protein